MNISHQAHCSERARYVSLKLTASGKGPMAEWHKPHEAIQLNAVSLYALISINYSNILNRLTPAPIIRNI